ncbi:MAG: hypothetical protein WD036_05380 [Bauldia sp.]
MPGTNWALAASSLARAAGALLLAWCAWTIVSTTAATTYAINDPETALAWEPSASSALIALAERRLLAAETAGDLAAADRLAERALIANPLEERGLRLLGFAADLRGEAGRAGVLMRRAAERSLRDPVVQAWLFDARVRSGDVARAIDHADVMLRTRPELGGRIMPALVRFAEDPAARVPLVAHLAESPPWREWFLTGLSGRNTPPGAALPVLSALRSTSAPPTDREFKPYLDRLIESGDFERAHLVWLLFLPGERLGNLRYIDNGDFERPIGDLPFDWAVSRIGGASTLIETTGTAGSGKAVHVVFAGGRVLYRNLAKLLVLPPGSYRLSGDVKTENLVNERGMVWRVRCAEKDQALLAETPAVAGTTPWHPFGQDVVVPASGCRAQWLTLELAARTAVEQRVSGEIWFDRLAISRVEGGPVSANGG